MPLRFDAAELQSYLDEVFPQVRGLFVIDEVHEDHLKMRMPVKEAHLRPGGTVSGPRCLHWPIVGCMRPSFRIWGKRRWPSQRIVRLISCANPRRGGISIQFAVSTNWAVCWLLGMR